LHGKPSTLNPTLRDEKHNRKVAQGEKAGDWARKPKNAAYQEERVKQGRLKGRSICTRRKEKGNEGLVEVYASKQKREYVK